MENIRVKQPNMSPFKFLAIGFLSVISLGAVLLALPVASREGNMTPLIDTFFTATSAVCVTGLVVVDTGTYWSLFGKTVILLLIEVGAMGFMAISTLFALVMGKRITLKERLVIQEAYNTYNIQGVIRHVIYLIIFTLVMQLLGALVLMTQFIPLYGRATGVYYSVFHSVSAFANAGFDLLGGFTSVTVFSGNPVILWTLMVLIVIGGLGYTVWRQLLDHAKNRIPLARLSLHSKVVLLLTFVLIFGGMLLFLVAEWSNPHTLQGMSLSDKVTNAFFASITPRTAGFNSISTSDMSPAGRLFTIVYMFIGGSPGSTAGGVKTTTFGIVLFTLIAVVRGRDEVELFHRRIPTKLVYKAVSIFLLGITLILVGTTILSLSETGATLELIVYEVVSALGTVGLSQGLTQSLSPVGKVTITILMYLGRVGPLTVMFSFAMKKQKLNVRYPEDKILIG